MLDGAEVKSLRTGQVELSDSFARIEQNEVFLKNAYIPPYTGGVKAGYNPRRDRKLLLRHVQIEQLRGRLSKSGVTLVPLSIYEKHNFFKVELALVASKRKFDKRRAIKERDEERKLAFELEKL